MRFSNLTILITGGAGGLGSAMARAFANEGGRVVVADIEPSAGKELVADIGQNAVFFSLDVSDEAAWRSVLDIIDLELGGLDVLINNVGFFQPNVPFEEMSLVLWRKHFMINMDGVFLGCKHGILRMKQRGGVIINIGSGMSIKAQATSSAYCASKAAVLMTTRTAAISAGPYNIRINAILPGPVNTRMLMGNITEQQKEEDLLETLATNSPLGQLVTSEDIARAALFLADPVNATITGIHLPVDGGNLTLLA